MDNLKSKIENLISDPKKELNFCDSEIVEFIQELDYHGVFVSKSSKLVQQIFEMKSKKELNSDLNQFPKPIQNFIMEIIHNNIVITTTKADFMFFGKLEGRKGKETKLSRFENPKIEESDWEKENPVSWKNESWEKEYSVEIDPDKFEISSSYEAWFTSKQEVYLIEIKF